MIQCFSEGVQGSSTIRAFKRESQTIEEYIRALDEFQKNNIYGDGNSRWFKVRLTLLSNFVVIPSLLIVVFFLNPNPGLFALLLRYLLFTVSDIDDLLDSTANYENNMVSLERCLYFSKVQPEEGYKNLEYAEEKMRLGYKPMMPAITDWPASGEVRIDDLRIRYRSDLPDVIKGITLKVEHGCKVGIVGRTGAGKSTFVAGLYRNFDEYGGRIEFGGRELREVDLKLLRSNMTIIPQDPHIFEASLKANLDPMELAQDYEMIDLLKEVGMWDKFERQKGLDTEIEQGGANLSAGEKQLLCLSRALLRRSKMIIMDEATANIDSQTEQIIQRLLIEKFTDCTVFMIAHRLNTIMHCDKILVLGEGNVIEFDTLNKLRDDPSSHFSQMLAKADELTSNLS